MHPPITPDALIAEAITLAATVPSFEQAAADLRRARIVFDPHLTDRGRAGLGGVITLGPEPFAGPPEVALVGVAGTLVHEHWHTRQNPLLKTRSFWAGVLTRTHPMRRYERPAYERQAMFLGALAVARPELRPLALRERVAVLASFAALYNGGKDESPPFYYNAVTGTRCHPSA